MNAHDEWQALLPPEPAGPDDRAGASACRRRISFRRRQRKIPYVITLNLTAMIDTIFNLLFLFIIISRFGAIEGMLPARLPARVAQAAALPAAELPRVPIRIRLIPDAANPAGCRATIDRFNETPVELKALPAALRRIRDAGVGFDRATPVHLLARDDVAWDHVVNAYNAAMAAEFGKIYFAGSS
ncbi:MAG: biopolymer transporter ExbD [Planctomycetes bacterium]|nr:biopolymer transporter ExbD [Planctomycetota bacterium]